MCPNKTEEGSGDEKLLGQRGVDVSQVVFLRKTPSLSGVENCSSEKSWVRVQTSVWTLVPPASISSASGWEIASQWWDKCGVSISSGQLKE